MATWRDPSGNPTTYNDAATGDLGGTGYKTAFLIGYTDDDLDRPETVVIDPLTHWTPYAYDALNRADSKASIVAATRHESSPS